jgi:hypothetical protein
MLDYNLDFKATLSQGFFLTCFLANFPHKKSLICNFKNLGPQTSQFVKGVIHLLLFSPFLKNHRLVHGKFSFI